jgi:hypothetical protein
MVLHRTALWVVMAACLTVAVLVHVKLRHARQAGNRHHPWFLAKAATDGLLTGLGLGLSAAFLILLAASVVVRLDT